MAVSLVKKMLLICDFPTKGKIFLRSSVEAMVERYKNSSIVGIFPNTDITDPLKHVVRAYNLRLDGNVFICDLTILDTPNGITMQTMLSDHTFSLLPNMVIRPDKYGFVTIDEITNIDVVLS